MTAAVILAGGLGTRLRAAVPDVPKPLAPVNGRPFLFSLMDYWVAQGVTRFVLSVGYRHQAISDIFGDAYRGVPVSYAVEERPLGTGGGLLLAMEELADEAPFWLLNGDTFFAVDGAALLQFHKARGSGCTFALFRATEAGRYMGLGVAADGRIETLAAGRGKIGAQANGGVYVLSPPIMRSFMLPAGTRVSFEDELLPSLLAGGQKLYGLECPGRFIDIGIPTDYARAKAILA